MTEENGELQPVGEMNMPTLMEDVCSESGLPNGLQGVNLICGGLHNQLR